MSAAWSPRSCCPGCASAWPKSRAEDQGRGTRAEDQGRGTRAEDQGRGTGPGNKGPAGIRALCAKLGIPRTAGRLCARFPISSNEYTVMPSTRTHAPRGALVFDMRQLGRQAGSALTQTRIVPAPDDLRLELIGVPPGADVALEVRFEAVSEGVL